MSTSQMYFNVSVDMVDGRKGALRLDVTSDHGHIVKSEWTDADIGMTEYQLEQIENAILEGFEREGTIWSDINDDAAVVGHFKSESHDADDSAPTVTAYLNDREGFEEYATARTAEEAELILRNELVSAGCFDDNAHIDLWIESNTYAISFIHSELGLI